MTVNCGAANWQSGQINLPLYSTQVLPQSWGVMDAIAGSDADVGGAAYWTPFSNNGEELDAIAGSDADVGDAAYWTQFSNNGEELDAIAGSDASQYEMAYLNQDANKQVKQSSLFAKPAECNES